MQYVDLIKAESWHQKAGTLRLKGQRRLQGQQRGGNLEIFPRVKLEDSFGEVEGKNG